MKLCQLPSLDIIVSLIHGLYYARCVGYRMFMW